MSKEEIEEKIIKHKEVDDIEEQDESLIRDIAKRFVPLEDPLPDTHDTKAVLEMLGRIEHELILYRRERVFRTYLLIVLFLLPILGLGFLLPDFLKGI